MIVRLLVPAVLLALSGCGKEAKPVGGSADGEILPGSASDAMLPLDTVRSQPPRAPKPTASATDGTDKAGSRKPAAKASEPAEAPSAAEPEQAPAAED
jgi:hypothetical protein